MTQSTKYQYAKYVTMEQLRTRGMVTKIASIASSSISNNPSQSSVDSSSRNVSHPSESSNSPQQHPINQSTGKRQQEESQQSQHHTSKHTAIDLGKWCCVECINVNPPGVLPKDWSAQSIQSIGTAGVVQHYLLYHPVHATLFLASLHPEQVIPMEDALHQSRTTLTSVPMMPFAAPMNGTSSSNSNASNLVTQPTDDEIMSSIVTLFATNAIARAKLKHPSFIAFLRTFMPNFQSDKLTQSKFLAELQRQATEAREALIKTLRLIPNLVLTLGFDGMSCHSHKYVNILLLSIGRSDYWTTIDCGQEEDTTDNEVKLLTRVIDDLRHKHRLELHGIVCDNSNNVVAAARKVAFTHDLIQLGCAAHQVQLVVRKMLEDTDLKCELDVFDNIISSFRAGKGSKKRRHNLSQLTPLKIVVPNDTRWNGIERSYSRLQEIRQHLITLQYDCGATTRDWEMLDALLGILGFFKEITDKVQSDSNSLFVTYRCFEDMRTYVKRLQSIKSQYTSRALQQFPFDGPMMQAIDKWSTETSSAEAIKAMRFLDVSVLRTVNESAPAQNTRQQVDENSTSNTIDWIKDTGSRILARASWCQETDKNKIANTLGNQCHSLIKGMVNGFGFESTELSAIAENKSVDVFHYWSVREQRSQTKELACFASILIRLIATEASVERSFSDHKLIQNNLRNRLEVEHIIQEMMIRWNHRMNVAGRSDKTKLHVAMAEFDVCELNIENGAALSIHSHEDEELE